MSREPNWRLISKTLRSLPELNPRQMLKPTEAPRHPGYNFKLSQNQTAFWKSSNFPVFQTLDPTEINNEFPFFQLLKKQLFSLKEKGHIEYDSDVIVY